MAANPVATTPDQRYALLVKAFLRKEGVTQEGRGFGSSSLRIGGSIFALFSSRGEFVVKLPRSRVEELIAAGDGHRFDPGHGRLMKEWLALRPTSSRDWASLAKEAMKFVGSDRPGGRQPVGR
ncbi:MAG TPA: hypothetical protein VJT14_04425 [Candidatus Dormibacteraeota bacterium]|nr:hypothetical protein [Candidatus Dormibacteraeota bacterium]